MEEKDRIILSQKEEIEELKSRHELLSDQTTVDALKEYKLEADTLREAVRMYEKKLMFTRNVTEQKILENISDPNFYRDDPHLVQVHTRAATL